MKLPNDTRPRNLIFPAGSSESPTPTSAEGAICPDGFVGGWVDGWVDGDQNGLSIFLIFKNIYKQNVLIPNMVIKLFTAFIYEAKSI